MRSWNRIISEKKTLERERDILNADMKLHKETIVALVKELLVLEMENDELKEEIERKKG